MQKMGYKWSFTYKKCSNSQRTPVQDAKCILKVSQQGQRAEEAPIITWTEEQQDEKQTRRWIELKICDCWSTPEWAVWHCTGALLWLTACSIKQDTWLTLQDRTCVLLHGCTALSLIKNPEFTGPPHLPSHQQTARQHWGIPCRLHLWNQQWLCLSES